MIGFFCSIFLSVSPIFASDAGHDEHHAAEFRVVLAQRPAKESQIPKEVVQKIKETLVIKAEKGEKEEKKKKLIFLSAEVLFSEPHHALFKMPVKVITPMGGGTVNLGPLIPTGKGKFNVRVVLKAADKTEVHATQVYFVPKTERANPKGPQEKQCGQFYDLTSFYKSQLSSEPGFSTYATDGIYAFNLVGSFIFIQESDTQVSVANVNFTDPRYDAFLCEPAE